MDENKRDILAFAMDGTSIPEFAHVDNTKYSQEIIETARAASDLEKLKELKDAEDLTEFHNEGKKQILAQWHAIQALSVHTDMFLVMLQIRIGDILNLVEPTFKKKGQFIKWVKDNFEQRHIRYFQQARQLADMGDFAKEYAAVGKNRLLSLENIRKVAKKREFDELFEDHPLPDIAGDEDGSLSKHHIDSLISLHRLTHAGIRFSTFENASELASINNGALTVTKTEEIEEWLKIQPEDQRQTLLSQYILDQMKYPADNPPPPPPKVSINKLIADLINTYAPENLEDSSWIERQRGVLDMDSLRSAQTFINGLIERMGSTTAAPEAVETE